MCLCKTTDGIVDLCRRYHYACRLGYATTKRYGWYPLEATAIPFDADLGRARLSHCQAPSTR